MFTKYLANMHEQLGLETRYRVFARVRVLVTAAYMIELASS